MWLTNLICLLAISDYFCQGIKLMNAFSIDIKSLLILV